MRLKPLKSYEHFTRRWVERMLSLYLNTKIWVNDYKLSLPCEDIAIELKSTFSLEVDWSSADEEDEYSLTFKLFLPSETKDCPVDEGLDRELEFNKFAMSEVCQRVWKNSITTSPIVKVLYSERTQSALTIVTENLLKFDYHIFTPADGIGLEETLSMIHSLSVIHAAGVVHDNERATHPVPSIRLKECAEENLQPNLTKLAEMYLDKPISKEFSKLSSMVQVFHIVDRYPLFKTVTHSYLSTSMCLFSPNHFKACLTDWHFCTMDNPVIDLHSLLAISVDPYVLQEMLEEVLEEYWSCFSGALKKENVKCPVTWGQFRDNFEQLWIYGFGCLSASVMDHLSSSRISRKRLDAYLDFIEQKNIFKYFDESTENPPVEK